MQTVKAYLYPNILEVQILDPTIFHLRKRTVYSRTIKIYKGIDNPIQLVMANQDNKAVNLTGYNVQIAVQNPEVKQTEGTFDVEITDAARGYGEFTIDREFVDQLEQRRYKLTVKLINVDNDSERPVYIDDNYSVSLDLEVLPGYY